jgi:class 3 adenylate cyclase
MELYHPAKDINGQFILARCLKLRPVPLAHEDHAVRACYAALAMQTELQRYAADVRRTQGLEMQARVGLNSGEVVVRAIGNDLHMDYSAVGRTTHLAARMEQLATPGMANLDVLTRPSISQT